VAAALVLVIAEFSTMSYRTIGIGACPDRAGTSVCRTTGHESHAFALLILVPVALVMAWGAVVGRSRAAAIALGCVGVAVLVIALAIDLPKLDDKRNLDALYDDVGGHTGAAFRLELVGGVLLFLVAGLALVRPEPGAAAEPRRRRARATAVEPETESAVEPLWATGAEPREEEPVTEPVAEPEPALEKEPVAEAEVVAEPVAEAEVEEPAAEPEVAEPEAEAAPKPRPRPKPKSKPKARGKGSAPQRPKQRRPRKPPSS
jgi:hypothetical protein